jgi:phosphatidylserine synthase
VAELWHCRFNVMNRNQLHGLALCAAAETMFLFLRIKSQAQKREKKHGNWFVAFTLLFPVHACMTARWSLLIQLSLKAEFNVLQFSMTLFCSGSQNRWHMITKIAWSNCLQIVSYCEKSHLATVSELYILVRFLLIYLNNY